jgi:hypothetical protein
LFLFIKNNDVFVLKEARRRGNLPYTENNNARIRLRKTYETLGAAVPLATQRARKLGLGF